MFNKRSDTVKEKISELENRSEEVQNAEIVKDGNIEERLRVMENKVKKLNMYLVEVLEDEEGDRSIFE